MADSRPSRDGFEFPPSRRLAPNRNLRASKRLHQSGDPAQAQRCDGSNLRYRLPLVVTNSKVFKRRLFGVFECLMPSIVDEDAIFRCPTEKKTGAVGLDPDV